MGKASHVSSAEAAKQYQILTHPARAHELWTEKASEGGGFAATFCRHILARPEGLEEGATSPACGGERQWCLLGDELFLNDGRRVGHSSAVHSLTMPTFTKAMLAKLVPLSFVI